jgi:predicted nuclease of restriction endonuclease-like (RecB) superfamily
LIGGSERRFAIGFEVTPRKSKTLLGDLRQLIAEARQDVARQVNSALVLLYWRVGKRIRQDILKEKRAEYGARIVSALGRQLEREFGRGFDEKSLRHMVRFAEAFPDEQIVSALRRQLGWTHFKRIIYLDDPLKRDFYAEMCRIERWSTRILEKKISGMLFERTALSKKPKELIRHELDTLRAEDKLTPDLVFRDPYFLDFLGLKDRYLEKDIEDAIMREIENFILELGVGFSFVARQKRIQVDSDDFYLDLLFFSPWASVPGGHRTETARLPARRQGSDGVLFALAGEIRAEAWRGTADRLDSLRREKARADRIARTGKKRHPCRVLLDQGFTAQAPAAEAS